jgi:hypothetical protein
MTEPHDIVFCSRKRSPSPIPVVATDHRLLQQLLQPPFGSLFVAAALDQHVEHHPALVGCAPEPMLHPGDLDDYLILSANSPDPLHRPPVTGMWLSNGRMEPGIGKPHP